MRDFVKFTGRLFAWLSGALAGIAFMVTDPNPDAAYGVAIVSIAFAVLSIISAFVEND